MDVYVCAQAALKIDVLFVLDATVSMKPNRDAVVKHLVGIVDLLSNMLKHSTVNVGIVAYRDFKLEPRFEVGDTAHTHCMCSRQNIVPLL